ncbi:unnamed protein product, partial [Staurois parvus]
KYRIFRSIRRTFFPPKKGGKHQCVLWSEYKAAGLVFLPPPCQNIGPGRSALLSCKALPVPRSSAAQSSRAGFSDSRVPTAHALRFKAPGHSQSAALLARMRSGHPAVTEAGAVRRGKDNAVEVGAGTCQIQVPAPPPSPKVSSLWSSPLLSAVSGHPLHCLQSLVIPCTVCSLWSSPVLCPQSLVISCTMSTVSGYLLYYVRSLWSSPVLCPQSLVISCTVSAVSDHLLYCVRSLWSSPVLCPQSLVISCTVSAVSG